MLAFGPSWPFPIDASGFGDGQTAIRAWHHQCSGGAPVLPQPRRHILCIQQNAHPVMNVAHICVGRACHRRNLWHRNAARPLPDVRDRREVQQSTPLCRDTPRGFAPLLSGPLVPTADRDHRTPDALKCGFLKHSLGPGVDERFHHRPPTRVHAAHRDDALAHMLKPVFSLHNDLLAGSDVLARWVVGTFGRAQSQCRRKVRPGVIQKQPPRHRSFRRLSDQLKHLRPDPFDDTCHTFGVGMDPVGLKKRLQVCRIRQNAVHLQSGKEAL